MSWKTRRFGNGEESRSQAVELESWSLAELRDALLPELLSGASVNMED